jgi:hypothetical protein
MQIATSLRQPVIIRTNGIRDDVRLSVPLQIHFGPKQVKGREATLIMDVDETISFALDLLRAVPAMALGTRVDDIKKIANVATIACRETRSWERVDRPKWAQEMDKLTPEERKVLDEH